MAGRIKLLVVDDEERFLKILSQRLEMRVFDVSMAVNGQEALEAAGREEFELALLDLKMPGLNGEQVLKLLKEKDPFIEVIILTGHGSLKSAVNCSRLGSHGYLQKPCETFELLKILKEAYKTRVRNKMNLSEDKMDSLLKNSEEDTHEAIQRILKKAEEGKA